MPDNKPLKEKNGAFIVKGEKKPIISAAQAQVLQQQISKPNFKGRDTSVR